MPGERVHFESGTGGIAFDDTTDHFDDAVLRLMIRRELFQPWLDASGRERGALLERLVKGYRALQPEWTPEDGPVRWPRIAENPSFGVRLDADGQVGRLIRNGGAVEREPPAYDEAYFEGGQAQGYGHYLAQAGWRLEKAARQVRELVAATGLKRGRVLDLGSGYGFFCRALADAGFNQAGVEVSRHARRVAKELYGFDSHTELREANGPFDAITLWDVIEHVPDPESLLTQIGAALAPGGFVALKTPNLDCPELEVFGGAYHSFKREHLVYFTPRSLERVARAAGLEPVLVGTVSHLLVGFFGASELSRWEQAGRGADIIGYFRRRAG
jgi:2-polyprenyl-3-methyl-5-hydroxy-6-metoxy-1,4-benzoquinol methylase